MHSARASFRSALRLTVGLTVAAFVSDAAAQIGWVTRPNFLNVNPDSPRPLMTPSDEYIFRDSHTGALIEMADPTIQWIDGYYYITGTDSDSQLGNFRIYRTRNFKRFDFFRYAFNEANRVGRLLLVSPGDDAKIIGSLQSPQLYLDPETPSKVFLVFTATVAELGSPTDDPTYENVIKVPTWDSDHWDWEMGSLPVTPDEAWAVNPLFPWDDRYGGIDEEELEEIWTEVPGTSSRDAQRPQSRNSARPAWLRSHT